MGSQSECHSYEEFSQIVKNPLVYNKIFICIYCFLLERIFFCSKAIHFYSKKFILSGGPVFKIIFDLFRFYKKCVIWPKKPENFALTRYYHSTKLVWGTFLSLFSRVTDQVARKSSRPKSGRPEPEPCCPKLIVMRLILSHVARNFIECLIMKKSNNRKE